MSSVVWTEPAIVDLESVHAYIGQNSEHAADAVVARLLTAGGRAGEFPEVGRMIPEREDPAYREVILRPYRILYRLMPGDEVHILRVLHGARSFPESL